MCSMGHIGVLRPMPAGRVLGRCGRPRCHRHGLALSSIYAVTLAHAAQKRVGSPIAGTADGYRGSAFGGTIVSLLGAAVLTIPMVLIAEFTNSAAASVRIPAVLLGAAAYGRVLARAGVHRTATVAAPGLAELCQIARHSTS